MDAIVLENKDVKVKHFDMPKIKKTDDILIKVKSVGLCKTDLMLSKGLLPCNEGQILGHEFSGIIVEVGNQVKTLKANDKVAVNPVLFFDDNNYSDYKMLGIDQNGALTEYIIVPEKNVYKVPDQISFEVAAYLEPIAAAMSILNIRFEKDKKVLIFGSGRIARLSHFILKTEGYTNIQTAESIDQIESLDMFDIIIENGIDNDKFNQLIKHLKIRGTFILKSRHLKEVSFNGVEIIKKEITLRGVNYGSFDDAYQFLINNHQYFNEFVGKSYPFDQYKSAFEDAINSDQYKQFINID